MVSDQICIFICWDRVTQVLKTHSLLFTSFIKDTFLSLNYTYIYYNCEIEEMQFVSYYNSVFLQEYSRVSLTVCS